MIPPPLVFPVSDPIERNLSRLFVNDFDREIMNSSILVFTLLQIFVYIKSNLHIFGFLVLGLDLFDKYQMGLWSLLNIW